MFFFLQYCFGLKLENCFQSALMTYVVHIEKLKINWCLGKNFVKFSLDLD